MATPAPIYTRRNCSFSSPLQWGLSAFSREPVQVDEWLPDLKAALEPDGIRLLSHRFQMPGVSQFALSTRPDVPPQQIVQRAKGRLQHLVREKVPKAWRRNFAIRSVGRVTRRVVEGYVASQLKHHPMADSRVRERLHRLQVVRPEVDLSKPRRTSHGLYWYNLHVVLVHSERWAEIREEVLRRIGAMILKSSDAKGYDLSRAGILPDHLHLVLGCPLNAAPADIALGFMNNLAYVQGMRPIYQFGAFVGTVGEYDHRALSTETKHRPTETSSVVAHQGW